MRLNEIIISETIAVYNGEGKFKGHWVFVLGKDAKGNTIQFMNGTQLKGVPDKDLTIKRAPNDET